MDYPLCFFSKELFEAWVALAEADVLDDNPRLTFCDFCTPQYQLAMIERGRCAFPDRDTHLQEYEDGDQVVLIS